MDRGAVTDSIEMMLPASKRQVQMHRNAFLRFTPVFRGILRVERFRSEFSARERERRRRYFLAAYPLGYNEQSRTLPVNSPASVNNFGR